MNLETLYHQVKDTISSLDFHRIWPGFEPLKFALYDNEKCFFDGSYIEKTDTFCANTSISYNGEQIAIWMVAEELEISVLTSKLVHEMFHGYQTLKGWDCWPNELETLFHYRYIEENLSLKLRENELMLGMLDGFDEASFKELLSLRRLRSEAYPYEFSYEMKTEEIEGTANYVEWQVLKQLDEKKADELTEQMRTIMTKAERLFPIRISCYYSGALMIDTLLKAGLYLFDVTERPVMFSILINVEASDGNFPGKELICQDVSDALLAFIDESESIIRSALERNEIVLQGPVELGFVNIYNARCYKGYLTSTYFLMYREGEENKMIQGNFVIRMKDEKTIETVYRWE